VKENQAFYDTRRDETYAHEVSCDRPTERLQYPMLKNFIERHALGEKRCLEIGSGIGVFQDMVPDYTGTDISESLGRFYHKPYFVVRPDGTYPFEDGSFDALWTITVFEHIPESDLALREMTRVLKRGGVVLFAPAWE